MMFLSIICKFHCINFSKFVLQIKLECSELGLKFPQFIQTSADSVCASLPLLMSVFDGKRRGGSNKKMKWLVDQPSKFDLSICADSNLILSPNLKQVFPHEFQCFVYCFRSG